MRPLVALTRECFLYLRRDKIFIPIVLIGLGISILAVQVSDFGIEDFKKIIYDVGLLGFRITGALVAIFWGAKLIQDPLMDRSIDLRIAAPIPRYTWFLARYLGFAGTLVTIAVLFVVFWQSILALNNFGLMQPTELIPFLFLLVEWLVLGALAMFFATSTRLPTALFATLALWVAGLLAPFMGNASGTDIKVADATIAVGVAKIWNFQRFNMGDVVTLGTPLDYAAMRLSGWYALALIALFLFAGSWRWSERDLQ